MPYGRGPAWVPFMRRLAGNWQQQWRPRQPPSPPLDAYRRTIRAHLDRTAAVVLNSSGGGFVTVTPDALTTWDVRQAQVSTTSGPTDPSYAFLYRDAVLPHRLIAQTSQGGGDSISFDALLQPGDLLICVWSNGDAGDVAHLTLTGTIHALAA